MSIYGTKAYPCHYSPTGIAFIRADGDACTCRPMRLTRPQLAMLDRLSRGESEHAPGHYRRQTTIVAKKLVTLGLIEWLEHEDAKRADEDDPCPTYALTCAGHAAVRTPHAKEGGT